MLAEGAKVTQVSARGGLSFAESCALARFPATAGLVFRSSTGAEVANFLPRIKKWKKRSLLPGSELAVDVLDLLLYPSHAADFDSAILPDQEQTRDIGQPVSV